MKRQTSLRFHLIVRQLFLQFLAVAAAALGFIIFFSNSGLDGMYVEETVVQVASNAIVRDASGKIVVALTPELARLQDESPDLWFAARLANGEETAFGKVPAELSSIITHLETLASADIRGQHSPFLLSAIVRQVKAQVGEMKIIAHGRVRPFTVLITVASNVVALAVFLALAVISVVATPIIVERSLAGLRETAQEATQIDADSRGIRLSEDTIPRELSPLVRAFNGALHRLDEGNERQRRFIASAAHELRTPIAILRMKIDASEEKGVRALLPDVLRLGNLAEQLLDLHRLDGEPVANRVDLAELARGVASELAPMIVAMGKSIEVSVQRPGAIRGDRGALQRVITNLIDNGIQHGGEKIVIRVDGTVIEVEDNGVGIHENERDRVFEPFYRIRPKSTGTGLGLSLAKQVIDHHHAEISILPAVAGGTIVRLSFFIHEVDNAATIFSS